ncbi:PD-(D/E)XK nuclease family protein [Sulfurimonas paralvinellae]|uniref:PD-(D/E)XK nuclease family protein n=1 Tax=Sulfurimonas paralvinellae TaxID=317658 RepID=A0A7M1BA51_9BACT|nr:PD-(D/E)XK nuclease family protein [Sulfurimonas paralvinellae]QOP46501.1 PD-(D/E)XK nuclease family protein [Sulfurimonas paralvinellae]
MDDELIVLPSARAIRHKQLAVELDTLFLPNFIMMSDFIAKLTLVEGYTFLDEDTRTLLLLEASDFQNFSNLQIERNFFTFTKNSSYIFKFFEELSAELFEIENLSSADLYGEYEEHITILQELYRRYEKLCDEKKLLDRIFLSKHYTFNAPYLKNYRSVEIVLEGYLTNFELELLQKATLYSEIKIRFTATRFNMKMQNKLRELGFEIMPGHHYLLHLNEIEVLQKESLSKNSEISCESFSEGILQVAFIKQKLYEFVSKGYDPEKIAVILPNEHTAKSIQSFDEKSNFNFAMGASFKESQIYKNLHAAFLYLDDATCENSSRLNHYGDTYYQLFYDVYRKNIVDVDFTVLMQKVQESIASKTEAKIFYEELHSFVKILPYLQHMNVRSVLSLFMQRLGSRSIDDVRGGKVTVMGVLETRSIAFDAVIIIDFDDDNVPKRSNKDMFLNTKLREMAGLPTMQERENLQKHYYEMLMSRSKEVAISYVSSEQNHPSRFLKELGITTKNSYDEINYAEILFARSSKKALYEPEIIEPYSFKNIALSNSRLKTYLSCKRKYYYHYVKHINAHEIPRDMPQEHAIGTDVHKALEQLYAKKDHYDDVRELQHDLERELENVTGKSELEKYLMAIQKKRLERFCLNEVKRFKEGWRVHSVEKSFQAPYAGMTLQGQIDRVDKKENLVDVLDYKTGSFTLYNKNNFTEATDFQLEFYHILAGGLGNVNSCAFYDLKEGRVVEELFLEQKLEILRSHIADLLQVEEVNFEKTEDAKMCQYCEFALMCGRA